LAFIDSWDGEAFKVSADGFLVYTQTHNYQTQSKSNTCQSASWPDAYTSVKFGFNHTASTLTLGITSALDQTSGDEAWGICDLTLSSTANQVWANGTQIPTYVTTSTTHYISTTTITYFACDNQGRYTGWTYSPSYSSISCPGTGFSYLGPYGSGGKVTSPALSLATHSGIIISLQLAFIDSWDGEAFTISADGKNVYSVTHEYLTQSFSNGCQASNWNDAFSSVAFGFNHTASTMTLVMTSGLDQDASDEAWGVCNLQIKTTTCTVNADGTNANC